MSTIISFELNKTYGTQNEDIAKKNKYNAIQVTRDIVVNQLEEGQEHDYIAEFEQQTSSADNTDSNVVALKYGEEYYWIEEWTDSYRTKINNAIAQLKYKQYSVSLDLNTSAYESLKTKDEPPQLDWLFSGSKYDEIYNRTKEFESGNISYTQNQWETFLNSSMSRDQFGLASGHSDIMERNSYTVSENIYRKEVDGVINDYNALDDIIETIQNGYDNTQNSDFSAVYDIIRPTITNWANDGQTVDFEIRIPYQIKFFDAIWTKRRKSSITYLLGSETTKKGILGIPVIGDYVAYNYYEYEFDSVVVRFYNDYKITGSETKTYYSGNRTYTAQDSFLFTKGTRYRTTNYEMAEQFANEIYEKYQNGKASLNIKYPLSPIYDAWGNQLFYLANTGIIRKVGDTYLDENDNIVQVNEESLISPHITPEEGMLCVLKKNDVTLTKPNSTNKQYYFIQKKDFNYNGICLNELTLATADTKEVFILTYPRDPHAILTVKRKKVGDNQFADIESGSTVENGDQIKAYYTSIEEGYSVAEYLYVGNLKLYQAGTGEWNWTIYNADAIIEPTVCKTGEPYIIHIVNDGNLVATRNYNPSDVLLDGDTIYGWDSITLTASCSDEYKLYARVNDRVITGEDDKTLNYTFRVNSDTTIELENVKIVSKWSISQFPQSRKINVIDYVDNKFICLTANVSGSPYSNAILSSDLTNWNYVNLPIEESLLDVAYGNATYIAIANYVYWLVSSDGINWTASQDSDYMNDFNSIVYGNNIFVSRRRKGLYYSTDGLSWTQGLSILGGVGTKLLAYGNGIFVAVSTNNKSYISSDGINWTEYSITSPPYGANALWSVLGYGGGKFVMFASGSQYMAISTDGINWTVKELPASSNWISVAYGNGKFVVISGSNNSITALTSSDGETWSKDILPFASAWKDVAYGNGKFVAVGFSDNFAVLSE